MIDAFYSALYTRLAAGTALTALVGGTTSPKIYHNQAPEDVDPPFLVYTWMGGGYTHETPGVWADGVLMVMAFSEVDQKSAGAIAQAVFNLLDRQPLTVTGWGNPALFAEAPHVQEDVTDESGITTYQCGDEYRIMLNK
jgi:hypothetical protein